MYQNFNLEDIITLVDADKLEEMLKESGYDEAKTEFLVSGFCQGFTLGYQGDMSIKWKSPNLKFRVGSEIELWNKVMKEVQVCRYVGPFADILFTDGYIQSPVGLMPKKTTVRA